MIAFTIINSEERAVAVDLMTQSAAAETTTRQRALLVGVCSQCCVVCGMLRGRVRWSVLTAMIDTVIQLYELIPTELNNEMSEDGARLIKVTNEEI